MPQYKIEFDKDTCIGTVYCVAVAEKFYEISDDGKPLLVGSSFNTQTNKYELYIHESDLEVNEDAAAGCPVEAIVITKLEN
jgi:ferredoxin